MSEKKRDSVKARLADLWLSLSLKKKIVIFTVTVILTVAFSIVFNYLIVNYSVNSFNTIMSDNVVCHDFQEAVSLESEAFSDYIRNNSEENRKILNVAEARTERCIRLLPFQYEATGAPRYAQTWSIKNSFPVYVQKRDLALKLRDEGGDYVAVVYEVYRMQAYLKGYADTLVQDTLKEGTVKYSQQASFFRRFPIYFCLVALVVVVAVLYLSKTMQRAIIDPVEKMAQISRHIAINDYTDQDVQVENKDEMGDLARAFNKMKHATVDYISNLEDRYRVMDMLHKEEVERVETEKNLNQVRLDLLKSQINPHFLFNTLNTIACSAKLEEAETTERMITALSSLFRYNLKTTESVVSLGQELKVVHDYMYIQQMRFGSRVGYEVDCRVSEQNTRIPSFTLQPIVENAIVHGISHKESGGRVHIRIWEKKTGMVVISVADTGLGIDKPRMEELREFMKNRRTAKIGIGFGNIYRRLHMMYREGDLTLHSIEGVGTVVQLFIPQEESQERKQEGE